MITVCCNGGTQQATTGAATRMAVAMAITPNRSVLLTVLTSKLQPDYIISHQIRAID